MSDRPVVFGKPEIQQPEIDEVVDSLKSGWLGTGPKTRRFEAQFAEFKGVPHAVALNSCTAALHLALVALELQPEDEVIVPSMTFAATGSAVIHAGAKPVLADCDRNTMNIDPEEIERRITDATRVLIPVHFAGRPCDMDAIMGIARRRGLSVVEDCAHAIETEYHGRKAGTFGNMGCFSFYVTKNVVTGEGGMLTTFDESLAEKIRVLALHGMTRDAWSRFEGGGYKHYEIVSPGFKYNMTDMQAALGIHQLKRVWESWKRRRDIWRRYDEAFADLPVFTPAPEAPDTIHASHLYTLLIDLERSSVSRDEFLAEMQRRGIGVGVHYVALHMQPYYQKTFGFRDADLPVSEWLSRRTVSIPLSGALTDPDVQGVIDAVRDILE